MTKSNNTPTKRTQRDYSLGFQLQVVAAVEKGEMTYKQAQKIYGRQGRSTVLTWLRKHGKIDWTQSPKMPMPKSPKAKKAPLIKSNIFSERLKVSTYVIYYSMKSLIFLILSIGQVFEKSI